MAQSNNKSDSVQILAQNDSKTFTEASNLLIKIIENILKDPENEKYRKIRISNPTLSKKLLPIDGAFQCLFEMGFEEADEFLSLPKSAPLDHLRAIQRELQQEQDRIQTANSPAQSSAETGASSQVTQQAGTTPQPTNNMAVFRSEAQFFRKLQASLDLVMVYEVPANQEKARQVIPIAQLQSKAKQKLQKLPPSDKGPDYSDLLLLELLNWFKKDFFQWVNQPPCERCGGTTSSVGMVTATPAELRHRGHRVENYRCGTCGAHTRFPRYNDPVKLLETRKGRCGEWANCFTLCCRSLDFEARYVLDWTDHVWTEVFSVSQDRWLHCDPCENTCDKPLVYEVGWKKKLSYVMAFARDDIQDVSWRYSCSHQALLSRRQECREAWLVQTILKLRKKKQESLDDSRKSQLRDRLVKELVEFLTVRKADGEELQGRVSGSTAWRAARGELGDTTTGSTATRHTIKPTPQEVQLKVVHLRYCCAADCYVRVSSDGERTEGWNSLVYEAKNVFRKEEQDWNMVYLARTEGSDEALISWNFDFTGSGLVLDRVEVTAASKCYENGRISWRLCAGDQCSLLPSDGSRTVVEDLGGGDVLTLTAAMSQGKGDVAWQHTQLFRQGSKEIDSYPLDISIHLRTTH